MERSWELEPVAPSARRARRLLRELLTAQGHEDWVDAAELAVSEVVTNAVLHAHTDIRLTASVSEGELRVEVLDRNPALPSPRGYDQHATTGRGIDLVSALTTACGVRSLGAEGKVVWFALGDDDQDHGGLERTGEAEQVSERARAVVLRSMPATLWLAAREHHDAILRETVLYRAEHPEDSSSRADLALADAARFLVSQALDREVALAAARGEAERPLPEYHPGALPAVPVELDLVLEVLPEHGAAFAALQDALDEAERLARADRLLIRPGLPEIVAVRDWGCEQVIAQLSGIPPAPWPGLEQERTGDPDGLHRLSWDDTPVRTSERGVVAADDTNRIVAVSAPLAAALGWDVDALIGRRVVALVPERYREAHVAGFSRHLSTGDARVLGVQIELPVLRADGTELTCTFLIESDRTARGRSVYLAWITPQLA